MHIRGTELILSIQSFKLRTMQDPRQFPPEEVRSLKVQKKKTTFRLNPTSLQRGQVSPQLEMPLPPSKTAKVKKNLNEVPAKLQQADGLELDSLRDSSQYESEYRTLRRKYLLLEEESFSLGKELSEIEAENKALEDEKLALLDQLVVLEGLMDPSELQSHV